MGWIIIVILTLGMSIALIAFWKDIVKFATPLLAKVGFAVVNFIYTAKGWIARALGNDGEKTAPVVISEEDIRKMLEAGIITPEEARNLRNRKDFYKRYDA